MVNQEVDVAQLRAQSPGPVWPEDDPHVSAHAGIHILGVRAPASPAALTNAAGDYSSVLVDGEGKQIISGTGEGGMTKAGKQDLTAVTSVQLLPSAGAGL